MVYDNNAGGEFAKYFVQDLTEPETFTSAPADYQEMYKKFSKRILWIDDKMVPGAFQMNTCWWYKPNREQTLASPNSPVGKPHFHEYPEILGFYGSDPFNPWDLGGEVEFWVGGEQHILTKSTMVFLPPTCPTARCSSTGWTGPSSTSPW